MFTSYIDQGILNHLQQIDHLLIDLNDIHIVRMQEQEAQLDIFIQEGSIQPLSEREGLFLITQNQLNNFYESLNSFNKRVDSVDEQINKLKEDGLKFSQDLHKQQYALTNLEKEKQSIEKILQEYQNNSSKIEEEEQYEGFIKKQFEQVKSNFQNTNIQELEQQVGILQSQLEERNKFINSFESNFNQQSENARCMQIEVDEQTQRHNNNNNTDTANQTLIQTYEKKIQLLYSQVTFYKKQADDSLKKIKTSLETRQDTFEKQMKKSQLLFAEDDEEDRGVIDIQFSNSRTLQIIELQKQVFLLEEEKDTILTEFQQYKKQTENDLIEMKSHKIEVQEYKQKLDEALKKIQLKANQNITKQQLHFEEFKQYALKIELLQQQNQNLKNLLEEEKNRVALIQKSYDDSHQKLENELLLKNEIIRRFDPNSDIFKEQQEKIQKLTSTIDQLRSDYQRIQHDKHQLESTLTERIEKLSEENKILLCMCEQIPQINSSNNPLQMIAGSEGTSNGKESEESVANNLFKQLFEVYKKKYQSKNAEYEMLFSEYQSNKQDNNKLIEENNKVKQQLRQLQLIHKQNKKIIPSNRKDGKQSIKDYEPLSQDIQNILTLNKDYKSKVQEYQLEIVGLRQEIESLKQLQDLEKSQSNSSSFEEIDLKPEQQELTEHILMMHALQKSDYLQEILKQSI